MDPTLSVDITNGIRIGSHAVSPGPDYLDIGNDYEFYSPRPDFNYGEDTFIQHDLDPTSFSPQITEAASSVADSFSPPSMYTSSERDSSSDDRDYSETVLKYINQILMEDDLDNKPCMFYDPSSLQDTERSFSDVLAQKDASSPNQVGPLVYVNHNVENPEDVFSGGSDSDCGTNNSSSNSTDPQRLGDLGEHKSSVTQAALPDDLVFQPNGGSQSGAKPSKNMSTISDGIDLFANNIFTDTESVLQFRKGLEEASKFLPRGNQLVVDSKSSMASAEREDHEVEAQLEKGEKAISTDGSRGRKNHEREVTDLEGRSSKQSAVYMEETDLPEMLEKVLLSTDKINLPGVDSETIHDGVSEALQPHGQPRRAKGGKSRAKKKSKKKDVIDLRSLLILCAQAIVAGDFRSSNEWLEQIRQHSSPTGDGSQRMAHFFANALEARLAGSGIGIQHSRPSFTFHWIPTSEVIKAYKLHFSTCPFRRLSIFFSTKMIYKVAEKASSLHIIDFPIHCGFHWPLLLQKLSRRPGGPPKLRITGIDYPQPGLRPSQKIEDTGRRLTKCCERFNVPFEYRAITSNSWHTIQIEDLKIDPNETLAVNSFGRFKNLLDESVDETSPRDEVLNLIRRMNPDIFVHTIVNGSYNGPFFQTRFREALFHFSALFDIFDATIPRDNEERLMLEREICGREIMNVVACEGAERYERPETYKQWQVRATRAGFRQPPLDQDLMKILRSKLKEWYHKDFELEEDKNWLLHGWKGRIVYASTCWVPTEES